MASLLKIVGGVKLAAFSCMAWSLVFGPGRETPEDTEDIVEFSQRKNGEDEFLRPLFEVESQTPGVFIEQQDQSKNNHRYVTGK